MAIIYRHLPVQRSLITILEPRSYTYRVLGLLIGGLLVARVVLLIKNRGHI